MPHVSNYRISNVCIMYLFRNIQWNPNNVPTDIRPHLCRAHESLWTRIACYTVFRCIATHCGNKQWCYIRVWFYVVYGGSSGSVRLCACIQKTHGSYLTGINVYSLITRDLKMVQHTTPRYPPPSILLRITLNFLTLSTACRKNARAEYSCRRARFSVYTLSRTRHPRSSSQFIKLMTNHQHGVEALSCRL
jgi:hypothetical protein